jgi:hypothetical protein
VAELGLNPEICGVGVVIVNVTALEAMPLGLRAATLAMPWLAIRLAGTTAVNCVPLKYVVESAEPLHCTAAPVRNPVPLTVRVNAGAPAVAELGLNPEICGVGVVIVNVTALEAMPLGLRTVTLAVPWLAIRLAGTTAVNCVPPKYVVESAEPFHCTATPLRNPVPLIVSVNAGPPAVAELGINPETCGVGVVIVNVTTSEAMPPGLRTVTFAVPWLTIRLAGIEAVNWALLRYVVESDEPFHCTVDPTRNPEPFTTTVSAGPPAVPELGFRPLIDGAPDTAISNACAPVCRFGQTRKGASLPFGLSNPKEASPNW